MRGAGGCGGPTGAAGRGTTVGDCGAEAVTEGAVGAGGAATVGGTETTGRGGGGTVGALGGAAGVAATAGFSAGVTTSGRGAGAGAFAAGIEGAAGGGVGRAAGGAGTATGRAATGGTAAGRTGGATASFCCVIAFSTSPGREMFDKSILVLISSSPRSGRADLADGVCASEEPRRWIRTFSASCSSSELEWVFFSVTPTIGSVSRMALLLTSSSLARSLIRTLLIRPFLYSALRLGLHCGLTESTSCTRTRFRICARVITILWFRESLLSAPALRLLWRFRRKRLLPSPPLCRLR